MNISAASPAIEIRNLARTFRRKRALDGLSLTVPRECVFGLLGENGAGKTTMIQHLLGSYIPQEGSVRVLGLDPIAEPVEVLSRIGYLSEDRIVPGWMTVVEMLNFCSVFYPNWSAAYADELVHMFNLSPNARVRNLSKGEQAKAELITALAHKPDLLILDEPSSGLDVIVRQEILRAILRGVADDGKTVFFSSHLIDEVERVCDYVAIMVKGNVVVADTVDHIRSTHSRITFRYPIARKTPPNIAGALTCIGTGHVWTVLSGGCPASVRREICADEATILSEEFPTLEDVFVARTTSSTPVGRQPAGQHS